jgi:predicted glycogen debranching enzyme
MLLLAALDDTIETPSQSVALSCQQYEDARTPKGYENLVEFSAFPVPEWRYETGGATLTRSLLFPKEKRALIITWTLAAESPPGEYRLRVRPLFAYRDANALTSENASVNMAVSQDGDSIRLAPYPGCPEFHIRHSPAHIASAACWYYRFQHAHDVAAGLSGVEDLFSPCELSFKLSPGASVWILAGTETLGEDIPALIRTERDRRERTTLFDIDKDPMAPLLAHAAEAFQVANDRLVAALPERNHDLRSALIALPGLLLCTRKLREARSLLLRAAEQIKELSVFGDEALWFARAGELYVDHSRDWDFLREELTPLCDSLARRYREGDPGKGFRIAPDGLLHSTSDIPLTWMNATSNSWPMTPRTGKPVEVNALWHHMLALLARWWGRRNDLDKARQYVSLRELSARSFRNRFWNEKEHCLFDVVDGPGGELDAAIRPNQLLAVALPGDLLSRRQAVSILSVVEKRLLTPRGLRTLSLEHPAFHPRLDDRRAARHQGAVFPWLIGVYVDAIFRVHGRISRGYARAEACLDALLREHLREACVGQISECFNGAFPHLPRGPFAHAAALGEIIRAFLEVKGRIW